MRRIHRIVVLATLLAIAPVIAGCADFDMDKLDVFHLNEKKKLPGKRVLLFPNGVPGVSQGIPPEYRKGYKPPADQQADAALAGPGAMSGNHAAEPGMKAGSRKTAAVTPVETKPKPKPKAKRRVRHKAKPKPKPEPKTAAKPAAAQPQQGTTGGWPSTQPQQGQGTTSGWPVPQSQQGGTGAWPATTPTDSNSAWPAAPPAGTFSKQ